MADGILLDVRDLRVSFAPVRAVDGVSLAVSRGPFGIALVGESGSGKTTGRRSCSRTRTTAWTRGCESGRPSARC